MKGWARQAARLATGFIYPPQCPSCQAELEITGGLCPDCWRDVVFLAGPSCRMCAAPVLADMGPDAVCDACAHAPPAWDRGRAAVLYDGVGRKLVLALKHGDRLDIAPLAADWLARAAPDLIQDADLIAPAPMHWRRLIRRRFNQAGELARSVADTADKQHILALDLLDRTRATETQDEKTRVQRQANVSGVFAVNKRWRRRIKGANVLLIDDVMTTGATLSECAETCRVAGAAVVNVVVMARVARGDWPA